MKEHISAFLNILQNERQLSPHTLKNYKIDIETAQLFFNQKNLSDWPAITENHLRALLAHQHKLNLSPRSINRQLSALRSFFDYLQKQGVIPNNPAIRVVSLKTVRPLPSALDVDEMAQLLDVDKSNPLAIRDKAILELFYSTGMRVSELVALNVRDLNLDTCDVPVLGKGRKKRLTLIGQYALTALKEWLLVRATLTTEDEPSLFINQHGKRLTIRSIQYRLQKWGLKQNIHTRVTPHRLRHSFASHLLESSQDLRAVQELLGHANLSTTEIYTKVNFQHLATVYDQCHPRDKFKEK